MYLGLQGGQEVFSGMKQSVNRNDSCPITGADQPPATTGILVMRNTFLIAAGLLLAATPALAIGPGGFVHGFSPVRSSGVAALPQTTYGLSNNHCVVFGTCIDGGAVALRAAWTAGSDVRLTPEAMPMAVAYTGFAYKAVRIETNPFVIPAASAVEESVDYGVLTGSVPSDRPL